MSALSLSQLLTVDWLEIGQAGLDTLTMLGASLLFTIAFGLPLGVVLYLTSPRQIWARPRLYAVLSFAVNICRSLPFVILLIVLIPLTLKLVGTSIGVAGSIPPLVAGASPFFARLVENVLREVDKGVIEASQSMGASLRQVVLRVLLPEALPGLIAAATVTCVTLVSYTAMSGVIGGGGLGDLAVRYGYQRFQTEVMIVTVLLLLVLVQLIQTLGDRLVRQFQRH
ncbi:MAG TPA: methionine ABC transporter permease [Chromobacteriaceae bacterium]|nr:methionine ABC transporter permease [Chromobacteriaceae bacterium]